MSDEAPAKLLGPCGTFPPSARTRCEACGRVIRCVYAVDDSGWVFMMGRRCYQRMTNALASPEEPR